MTSLLHSAKSTAKRNNTKYKNKKFETASALNFSFYLICMKVFILSLIAITVDDSRFTMNYLFNFATVLMNQVNSKTKIAEPKEKTSFVNLHDPS